ncbi:MAG: 2-oxoacid:ferredoxin oxidoreductase subunit beta [Candidatus Omnitrophota bacterium]|jgi:2-oxoglutarate ferredoxin oxidoreductase subunit beta|nr:MAG: 2-oxoacid:ferredoxin oxidoreductase subunit beta [Candidatus Omnitrophota bacterium]
MATLPKLSPKDYASDQEVRWCPGCGDYSILAQMKKVFSTLQIVKENAVFVSGIGCSSRFPYYMDTYGIHGIHGRAPAIAAGLKIMRPELSVWVITGDGDGLSIGGNHLLHAIRRNLDINIILFNNRIYGLTKGQYSPTSEFGKKTKSTPLGSVDYPLHPLSVAIGAEATFVARSIDVHVKHLADVLEAAARHKGVSFVEIYQNCNIFNDGAYEYAADRSQRFDNVVELEHGKPLQFGKNKEKGIRWNGSDLEIVTIGENGISEKDLLVHNEKAESPASAFLLSRMTYPQFPEPIGIFRNIERPSYEELIQNQVRHALETGSDNSLESFFHSGETWVVE